MIRVVLIAACLGFVVGQDAAIDSRGILSSVIRRETLRPHSHKSLIQLQQDPAPDNGTTGSDGANGTTATDAPTDAPADAPTDAPAALTNASTDASSDASTGGGDAPTDASTGGGDAGGGDAGGGATGGGTTGGTTGGGTTGGAPVLTTGAGGAPVLTPALASRVEPPIVPTLDRPDLKYNYVEEKSLTDGELPTMGACASHFEYHGVLSNELCAKRCFDTPGCTRFSAGGCFLGCRVSAPGVNDLKTTLPLNGQCPISTDGQGSGCVVYKMVFFRAVESGKCSAETSLPKTNVDGTAKNKAQCAHECKNTAGCKSFTAEPNCAQGCRISKDATDCTLSKAPAGTASGCFSYEVFR